MSVRELHVAVQSLVRAADDIVVPNLAITVWRDDGATIRDEISPEIAIKSGGVYLPPAALNALMLSAAKTHLEDANGWNVPNAYDAEYIYGGSSPAASIQVVKKLADTVFASASPADVPVGVSGTPTMSFSVTADTLYRIVFESVVRSDTATVGVAMSLTYPTATVFAGAARFAGFAADGAGAEWHGNITASDDAVVPTDVAANNTDYLFVINAVLIPSVTGTVVLRARTETGTTNVTVRQGSLGMLWVLGPA